MNKTLNFLHSSLSLAIAANIGAGIIANVTGGAVSNSIDGKDITRRSALTLFTNRLAASITATRDVAPVIGVLDPDSLLGTVFDTAASLSETNLVVEPVNGTPIRAVFTEAIRAINSTGLSTSGTVAESAQNYESMIMDLLYGGESKSSAFATSEELVVQGARAVGSLTSLCHTHINPFVNETIDAVRMRFKTLYMENANAYVVKEQYLFGLLNEQVFLNHVEGFAAKEEIGNAGFTPLLGNTLLTSEFVGSLLYTGINLFDETIKTSLMDTDSVERARGWIINGAGAFNNVIAGLSVAETSRDLTALFLILRAMSLVDYQERLKDYGLTQQEINSVQAAISGMLSQVAIRLLTAVKRYKGDVKSNTLLLNYSTKNGVNYIAVNGEVYQAGLKQVENAEAPFDLEAALLGALFIRDTRVSYLNDFITHRERLIATYKNHRAEMESANQSRLTTTAQAALFQGLRATTTKALGSFETANAYALTNAADAEAYSVNGETISRYVGAISQHLNGLTIRSADDFEWAVVNTICNVFYSSTGALKFFRIFDSVGKSFPEVEAKEVAAIACVEYILSWLSDQFTVSAGK